MVLFRDSAKRHAQKLDLVGFVKNEPDGGVFAVAEGEEEKLKQFIDYLMKGPPFARVDNIETEWLVPAEEFTKFKIEY